ncbi:MAG: hypothetical protein OEM40_01045 [Acidimicrobiia bacterium]|nr:hypothetical protein [Acidimicrobiia bacterium]
MRYVYRFDIRRYFESIYHGLLTEQLVRDLGSVEVASLLISWMACPMVRGNVIRSSNCGLALGMPIAPTLANHFLADFDRVCRPESGACALTSVFSRPS